MKMFDLKKSEYEGGGEMYGVKKKLSMISTASLIVAIFAGSG